MFNANTTAIITVMTLMILMAFLLQEAASWYDGETISLNRRAGNRSE
jgi:hypothetical protein